MYIEYKRARFIRNEGRRFKCWIEIDGKEELCYVASSSKLNHYLDIEDKEILVIENKSSQRKLKYRLFAVRANEEWIVLDLLLLNHIVKEKLENEGYIVESEKFIEDYRADLLIRTETEVLVCEIKSVLCLEESAVFPMNAGKRCAEQLEKIKDIITFNKYKVLYVFVLLTQNVKRIEINQTEKNYKELFSECLENGMKTMCCRLSIMNNEVIVHIDNSVIVTI